MIALEWLYAALGAIGGSAFTAFFLQKIAGNLIDRKFREADKNKAERRRVYILNDKRIDSHATMFKRINHGIRQFQKANPEALDWWNGEYCKGMDYFIAVENEVEEYNRERLADVQGRK